MIDKNNMENYLTVIRLDKWSHTYQEFGSFPFNQNFRDFRAEIEWNGQSSGKFFEKFEYVFIGGAEGAAAEVQFVGDFFFVKIYNNFIIL